MKINIKSKEIGYRHVLLDNRDISRNRGYRLAVIEASSENQL